MSAPLPIIYMMKVELEKQKLRKELLLKRNGLISREKVKYDAWICKALENIIIERDCKVIHSYLPIGSEIDLRPLIANLLEKNIVVVVVPKTLKNRCLEHIVLSSLDELEQGLYGTSHPKEGIVFQGKIDVIIVPGLAFDQQHYRLGYGGGYYDSFLAEHPNALSIGVCYPFQKIVKVPRESHDARLDLLLVKE